MSVFPIGPLRLGRQDLEPIPDEVARFPTEDTLTCAVWMNDDYVLAAALLLSDDDMGINLVISQGGRNGHQVDLELLEQATQLIAPEGVSAGDGLLDPGRQSAHLYFELPPYYVEFYRRQLGLEVPHGEAPGETTPDPA